MSKFEAAFAETVDELEREARRVGLSQEALAVAGGVSSSTVRRWKTRTPTLVTVIGKMQVAIEEKRQTIQA